MAKQPIDHRTPNEETAKMGSRRRLLGEMSWATLAQVMSALAALVMVRALTEYVSPTIYGLITLLLGVFTLVQGTMVNPIVQAALRSYPDYGASRLPVLRKTVTTLLWRRTAVVLVLLLASWPLLDYFWQIPPTTLILLGALFVLEGMRTVEAALLNAARRQRAYALMTTVEAWVKPGLVILTVSLWESSAEAVFLAYAVTMVLILAGFYGWGQPEGIQPRAAEKAVACPQLSRAISAYALPLAPMAIMDSISGVGDRYIVAALLGIDKAGIYAATYGLLSRPFLMMGGTLDLTLRPIYYQSVASGNHVQAKKLLMKWLVIVLVMAVAGFVLSFFLKEFIVRLFLARDYWVGAELVPWIAGGYALLVVSNVFEKVCYAYGETGRVLTVRTVASISGLIIAYWGIAYWGFVGAAMAVPIYFCLQGMLSLLAATLRGTTRYALQARES